MDREKLQNYNLPNRDFSSPDQNVNLTPTEAYRRKVVNTEGREPEEKSVLASELAQMLPASRVKEYLPDNRSALSEFIPVRRKDVGIQNVDSYGIGKGFRSPSALINYIKNLDKLDYGGVGEGYIPNRYQSSLIDFAKIDPDSAQGLANLLPHKTLSGSVADTSGNFNSLSDSLSVEDTYKTNEAGMKYPAGTEGVIQPKEKNNVPNPNEVYTNQIKPKPIDNWAKRMGKNMPGEVWREYFRPSSEILGSDPQPYTERYNLPTKFGTKDVAETSNLALQNEEALSKLREGDRSGAYHKLIGAPDRNRVIEDALGGQNIPGDVEGALIDADPDSPIELNKYGEADFANYRYTFPDNTTLKMPKEKIRFGEQAFMDYYAGGFDKEKFLGAGNLEDDEAKKFREIFKETPIYKNLDSVINSGKYNLTEIVNLFLYAKNAAVREARKEESGE